MFCIQEIPCRLGDDFRNFTFLTKVKLTYYNVDNFDKPKLEYEFNVNVTLLRYLWQKEYLCPSKKANNHSLIYFEKNFAYSKH